MATLNLAARWERVQHQIWDTQQIGPIGWACSAARVVICTARELMAGELTLRAMSLVYTTLLSLVPLLALAFSLLKGLGVHNRIEPLLARALEPLGPSADKITETVIGFVDNVKIGVLGSIGIALLFYTVLAMIQKIEVSFNHIWKIPRQRPLTQRITEYLVVLLLGPLAVSLVIGTTASLSSNTVVDSLLTYEAIGLPVYWLGRLVPYALIVAMFSFVFMLIPNTRVQARAALTGGLVSGLLWQSAAWGFANFVAGSGSYNAVYSSFAILILLLIWIYLAWLILLTGCQISFFIQHPEYLQRVRRHSQASALLRDRLAITLLLIVQQRFVAGRPGITATQLARLSGAAPDIVNPLIEALLNQEILAESAAGHILPQRDLNQLAIEDLLQGLSRADEPIASPPEITAPVDALAQRLAAARREVLGTQTIGDLLDR